MPIKLLKAKPLAEREPRVSQRSARAREALEGSYDELFAQVTKARQQAVELEHLEKAELRSRGGPRLGASGEPSTSGVP